MSYTYRGVPIVITTVRKQKKKKHKKWRINKKWAKRYGFDEFELMDNDGIIIIDGNAYMKWKTFEKIKGELYWVSLNG